MVVFEYKYTSLIMIIIFTFPKNNYTQVYFLKLETSKKKTKMDLILEQEPPQNINLNIDSKLGILKLQKVESKDIKISKMTDSSGHNEVPQELE